MPNIPAHIDATDDAVVAWIESDEFEPGECATAHRCAELPPPMKPSTVPASI